MDFDWSELAFASKKPINSLKATFIAAPREISAKRFTQLIKTYLPKGNIVIGFAKEPYVLDFEGQPQFRMLDGQAVRPIIDKVNKASAKHKIYTLRYFQRELPFIFDKLRFTHCVFVNGSWHYSFHLRPEYYRLTNAGVSYELVSPFVDDAEAKAYASHLEEKNAAEFLTDLKSKQRFTEREIQTLAANAAKESFDYTHQIGVVLAKPAGKDYSVLATAINRVVPYQTYAMHHGALREQHFSPANDLNYYDTVHAETELIITAQKQKLDLHGTCLFINVLPCPTCARMLSQTDISEIVYQEDHSAGYAVQLLQAAGKTVRRRV